tara:strand:- start:7152 stop:7700 length:549 start_codon:yes stop_codon:yes gene_type:complete
MKSLILGGVKSGKSRYAEACVKDFLAEHKLSGDVVCLIATAEALDEPMRKRIEIHKQQRPNSWLIIEEPISLANALLEAEKTSKIILIDCLTLWLTNLLMLVDKAKLAYEIERFLLAVSKCAAELVIVSNETNMGIMPLGELSRDYCDKAGSLHQLLAEACDQVSLVVAGLPLSLKSPLEQA